jgi:uncharacterized membrane protein
VKRLPPWLLFVIAVLTVLLLWVGIDERDEVGPVPIVLGVIWVVFVLASIPKIFSRDDSH